MSSSFTPSPAELALVSQIFAQADSTKIGILTGDVAVKAFAGAKLSPLVLGEIWSIADEDNKGWLSKKGVAISVRLMGWAQTGEKITPALVNKPGPLPTIEGISVVTTQNTGPRLPKSPPPALPLLTPLDKVKFQRLFANNNPVNGLLPGEKARDIFVKSQLPVDTLSRIWSLADTQDRGALDCTDFVIGLYLIQASMSGQLSFIPNFLPPGLYEQAGGGGPPPPQQQPTILTHTTGTSGSISPTIPQQTRTSVLHSQYTGQQQNQQQPPLSATASRFQSRPGASPAAFPASPFASPPRSILLSQVPPWDVTAAEKASSDRYFDTLDHQRKGYIDGDAAVPFMLESKLSGDELAHIWDLSDLNKDGRLTRDGFAVALHLIHAKLAGKATPRTLPLSLVPTHMRTEGSSNVQQQHEPQADLVAWDETPAVPISPLSKSILSSQQTGSQHTATTLTSPVTQPLHDPFSSTTFYSSSNLLDDESPVTPSQPLQDKSAEIGNMRNQVDSTVRSMETVKTERVSVEQTLADQSAQLSALQTQLSSAKAAYETETRLLATLRERWTSQTADIQNTREELIRAESDLSAVRVEKSEVEGSFLRDKEEARELHRKMVQAGQQAETTKVEVEKVKKEAKQQKGLLAIARKQLSTKEAERAKAEKELENASAELVAAVKEREELEAALEKGNEPDTLDATAAAVGETVPALPNAFRPSTPSSTHSANVGKSNNPFDRMVMSSSAKSSPRPSSAFLPLANTSSLPTPVSKPEVVESGSTDFNNPFTFSQVFDTVNPAGSAQEAQQQSTALEIAVQERGKSTPKVSPAADASTMPPMMIPISPTSPHSDASDNEYATPPTTAPGLSRVTSPSVPNSLQNATSSSAAVAAALFPDLNGVAAQFPALEDHTGEVDLKEKITEREVKESDSDSDDDGEDSIPLAKSVVVVEKNGNGKESDVGAAGAPTGGDAKVSGLPTSFDNLFSQWAPSPASDTLPPDDNSSSPPVPVPVPVSAPTPATAPKDAFGVPVAQTTTSPNPPFVLPATTDDPPKASEASQVAAGVNAFDEAMVKISSNGPSIPLPQFSFDSIFEDNFDFASAAEVKFPPQTSTTATNGTTTTEGSNVQMTPHQSDNIFPDPVYNGVKGPGLSAGNTAPVPLSFDDAFSTKGQPPLVQSATNSPSPPLSSQTQTIIFDGAISGVESPIATAATDGFSGSSSLITPTQGLPSLVQTTTSDAPAQSTPFPTVSPPASPRVALSQQRTGSSKPASPPPPQRQRSPPPRVSPPKAPRPSTSSSGKDGSQEKPPARHSKLSIRLPFGRKKKQQQETPPPPPAAVVIPQEELSSEPALSDDIDSVKQLCGMGFTRTQVVSALEMYGYDMQKALNNLLGQ